MARITIKTKAYARNRHFIEIVDALRTDGFTARPNVAVDGHVSIDTTASADYCRTLLNNRPETVWLACK